MGKSAFLENWKCYKRGEREKAFDVTLPHDAMLLDEKSENSPAGVNTGWYVSKDYVYEKTFFIPEDYRQKEVFLEFEAVYHKATIYINDKKVAYHDYGYTGFYVSLNEAVVYGSDNIIRVEVINSDQPNSRWYSGTGIYRPVWLYVLPKKHILQDGIRITTLDYKNPAVEVEIKTSAAGKIDLAVLDQGTVIAAQSVFSEDGSCRCDIDLLGAKTWSVDEPYLYTLRVTFGEEERSEHFGIRVISCDAKEGLCINGARVILRGACIHHDNGILGACAYDFAEERKVRILKESGYNAIRSAHNPCSKAMLRACDELGMLMMDEYVDVWYIHKTKYDYAAEVEAHYEEDIKSIVDKDYNHPSVILYSTGNEVAETAQKRGIALCGKLTGAFHDKDATRPVTCGINIFFNFLSSMGFGVYSDKKAEQAAENAKKKKAVGSEFFNTVAGVLGANFMKFGATLYPCDVKTRDAFLGMDIAGYNYGIFRYRHDLKKYKSRLILGSETFCADAYRFMEEAKKNKRIVGDFVWSGMDYLGEVGIGSWEYENYAPRFDNGMGWVSAGSGRIDLTGKPLAEMSYTRVAFELDKIGIGVVPADNAAKKHSPSAWKMTNAIESWSFDGCEGNTTKVEVYARAHHISLFVNGICVGTKKTKRDCKVIFTTQYQNGEIRAVAYGSDNEVLAEKTLKTAGKETLLTLKPEQAQILKDDLAYIRIQYTDKNGLLKPLERAEVTVAVTGGTLIGMGSACPYYTKSYQSNVADTYYGEALAIVKPDGAGKIVVTAESKFGNKKAEIEVK